MSKCSVKSCGKLGSEGHHILYANLHGQDVVRLLCREHHTWITCEQAHQARKIHHGLSASFRWFLWFKLINGEMKKPRYTHLDWRWEHGAQIEI